MIIESLYLLIEKFILFVGKLGYLGIFIGMTLESTFIPVPSEMILIPAGVLVAKGEFSFFLVLFFSVLGSVLGATINYTLALFIGRSAIDRLVLKYGKFVFITKERMDNSEKFFKNYGGISTFIGRLLPGVRHLISIPAGFFKMKMGSFLFLTALGSAIWTCVLLAVGYFFNEIPLSVWTYNSHIIYIVSILICALALAVYLIMRKKER